MSRIAGIDPDNADPYAARVLKAQQDQWGAPLANHRLYARRPALFKAVRGMWTGLDRDGLLGDALIALVNRRVAMLNDCPF